MPCENNLQLWSVIAENDHGGRFQAGLCIYSAYVVVAALVEVMTELTVNALKTLDAKYKPTLRVRSSFLSVSHPRLELYLPVSLQ